VSELGDTLCQNLGNTLVPSLLKSASQLGYIFWLRAVPNFDRRAKFEKFRFVQGTQEQIGYVDLVKCGPAGFEAELIACEGFPNEEALITPP
jgi:hypothetical protein